MRWKKIKRKKYLTEKTILTTVVLLVSWILLCISLSAGFYGFLIGFLWVTIIFVMYLVVIFVLSLCKKIITSDARSKWIKVFLVLLSCIVIALSVMFIIAIGAENKERAVWENARLKSHYDGYHYYLEKYPRGRFVEYAWWRIANNQNRLEYYKKYLEKFPSGKFSEEALQRISVLKLQLESNEDYP